ncbi:MAG: PQQ-binding-like beta-propeller repeat protein [Pirellula sp.]
MNITRRCLILGSMLVWIMLLDRSQAWAQGRFNRNFSVPQQGALMPAPREVQLLLDEARANIENQQWSEATLALGLLLGIEETRPEGTSSADYFVVDEGESLKQPTYVETVYKRAMELMETLPLEATKLVDVRYGVNASQSLEKAVAESDWEGVENVAGKFYFTTSGQDACIILGELWLRRGEPRRAARFFETVFRQKSGLARLGPELGILLAASYESAGMRDDAYRCIEATKSQFGSASIDWMGSKVGWEGRSIRTKDIVESIDLKGTSQFNRVVRQPHYMGGNAERNADTNAGVPLPILRWHTELHESKQQKDNLDKDLNDKLNEGKSTVIPSRIPINVGPWVIASTYDQRIVAVDMLTGRIGWECFYSGMPLGFSMDRFPTRDSHSLNLSAADYLAKRVWGESAVGMPSSDGERVFSISELPAIDIAESFAAGQNARVAKPQGVRNFNVMQCWSIREEGKLAWEVGGLKSPTEPKLAGVLFLGAPLPHNHELYVMGEVNSDVYLFALKPETGKLLWRQPLATNLGSIATDQLRRSIGCVPAADGGIIICPTLSGYLVGFDSVSRSLRWAFRYNLRNVPGAQNQIMLFGQQEPGDYSPFLSRSADVSVVIHDGIVFFAPSDGEGENVYAISAESGALLWQSDSRADQVRYIAGAWNGVVLVANQSSFVAMDVHTGKEKWPSIDLPNDAQVVGRGVRKQGMYFLPTSTQEILQIDLERGAIVESVKTEKPLGNLVSAGDRIICASPYELDCYTVREAFQSQLKQDLQMNSASRAGLTRQGELALAKGEFDAALSFLEQAKKLEPNNAEVVMLLNKVGLAALIADFDKYVDRVSLSQDLAYDRDRLPYLRMLVQGLQRQGRYKDALLKLLELSQLRTLQRQDQVSGNDVSVQSPTWSVQEDRWIATQVQRCADKLTPEQWKDIEDAIDDRREFLKSAPSNVRRLILGHLSALDSLESLRLDSASELIQHEDYLQAEQLLVSSSLHEKNDSRSVDAKRRRLLLGEIYAKKKRFDRALPYLDGNSDHLANLFRDLPATELQELLSSATNIPKPKLASEWPSTRVEASTSFAQTLVVDRAMVLESCSLCRWRKRVGDALQGWTVQYGQGSFSFANSNREEIMRCFVQVGNQDKGTPNVYSIDSIVLAEMNREIIAFNTLGRSNDQNGPLWRESFETIAPEERGRGRPGVIPTNEWGLPSSRNAFRVASVSRHGFVVLSDDSLICLDVATGKRHWTSTGFKDCQFASNQEVLMCFSSRTRSIVHLDLRDGAKQSTIPLDEEMTWVGTVGTFWLVESAGTPRLLHLLDSTNGKVVLSKQFSADTKLALDGETGVLALQVSGALTYWKLPDAIEFVTQAQVEGKINSLTAHRFGDTILVMPFSAGLQIDLLKVAPATSDPGFAPLAGRIIAISAEDGKQVWKQNNLVRQVAFPIAQDRSTPFAVFVRRITLPKVDGVEVDSMSIAALDVRDGRVLYSKDDLPAARDRGFMQKVFPLRNSISVDYLGSSVTLKFLEQDASRESIDQPKYDFGDVDEKEFRKVIEDRVRRKAQ